MMRYHHSIGNSCAWYRCIRVSYCAHQRALLVEVGLAQHLLVDFDQLPDRRSRRSSRGDFTRGRYLLRVQHRVDHAVAVGLDHDVEVAGCASPRSHGPVGTHLLRRLHADLAPFVDQPGADVFVGLIDVAVEQLEPQPLLARLPSADAAPRRATSRCRARSRPASAAPPWSPPAASRGTRCRPRCARWRSSTAPARRATGRPPAAARGAPARRRTACASWLGVIRLPQFQSLVCTVTLSPSSR